METVERGRKRVPSLGNGRESREEEMKHGRAGGVGVGVGGLTGGVWGVSHHSAGEGNVGAAAGEWRDAVCLFPSPSICISLHLSAYTSPSYLLGLHLFNSCCQEPNVRSSQSWSR